MHVVENWESNKGTEKVNENILTATGSKTFDNKNKNNLKRVCNLSRNDVNFLKRKTSL